jgi:hypothetical protein
LEEQGALDARQKQYSIHCTSLNLQRRIETAWEKENFNPKEPMDATKRVMEIKQQ